ncbi:MAG TPA: 4a-hydroxytetrahydrobiopterin dehydratase [Phycisphaerales bacterium]|nr:4a-hydroxytetrahydrobiopterin dehydratase [Phycisphaerales bacterium]
MDKMTDEQVLGALKGAPDWAETGGQIHRTFQFKDFVESMKFLNAVAEYAESVQHHPDILIRWNKVTLTVSTHDAGGITEKDFALAAKADELACGFLPAAPAKVKKAKK